MIDKRFDLALALTVAAAGVALFVLTQNLQAGSLRDPIGPRALPTAAAIVLMTGGGALAARRIVRWRAEPVEVPAEGATTDQPGYPASTARAMSVWLACGVYVALLTRAGFIIMTPLLVAALLWVTGVRRPTRVATLSLTATAVLYLLFSQLLNVRLPLGPFAQLLG